MDRLPEELVALICYHCDHASLKNTRLVDHRFRRQSTPRVFEHFYVGLFHYHLSKLQQLAHSPLAKFVHILTFYCDILPLDWDRETWRKAIDFRLPFRDWLVQYQARTAGEVASFARVERVGTPHPTKEYERLPRHHFSEEQLEMGYAEYRAFVQQQVDWPRCRLSLPFMDYFARLPNLQETRVTCAKPFQGPANAWPVWKALRQRIFVGPDDWMYTADFQESSYAYLSGQAALALLEGVVYRASFAGTKHVTTLKIHSPHLDTYAVLAGDGSLHKYNAGQHHLCDAFRNLTCLHIHVPHATLSARLHGSGVAEETIGFLRSAIQLRVLSLRYGDDELSPDDDASQLEGLFVSNLALWPHLTTLSLATNVPADILIEFLQKHATTLRSLELRDMLIHNVDHVIREIPRILTLAHVYMECLWDDAEHVEETGLQYLSVLSNGTDFDAPYERAVKAYLLAQSETMPTLERDGGMGEVDDFD